MTMPLLKAALNDENSLLDLFWENATTLNETSKREQRLIKPQHLPIFPHLNITDVSN
jgi:hypothetical protein